MKTLVYWLLFGSSGVFDPCGLQVGKDVPGEREFGLDPLVHRPSQSSSGPLQTSNEDGKLDCWVRWSKPGAPSVLHRRTPSPRTPSQWSRLNPSKGVIG